MKKTTIALILILSLLLAFGCQKKEEPASTSTPTTPATATPVAPSVIPDKIMVSLPNTISGITRSASKSTAAFGYDIFKDLILAQKSMLQLTILYTVLIDEIIEQNQLTQSSSAYTGKSITFTQNFYNKLSYYDLGELEISPEMMPIGTYMPIQSCTYTTSSDTNYNTYFEFTILDEESNTPFTTKFYWTSDKNKTKAVSEGITVSVTDDGTTTVNSTFTMTYDDSLKKSVVSILDENTTTPIVMTLSEDTANTANKGVSLSYSGPGNFWFNSYADNNGGIYTLYCGDYYFKEIFNQSGQLVKALVSTDGTNWTTNTSATTITGETDLYETKYTSTTFENPSTTGTTTPSYRISGSTGNRGSSQLFLYDTAGRAVKMEQSIASSFTGCPNDIERLEFTYDTNGNLILEKHYSKESINSSCATTETYSKDVYTYSYYADAGNLVPRLYSLQVYDGIEETLRRSSSFTYDSSGKVSTESSSLNTYNYYYDSEGRLSETQLSGQPYKKFYYNSAGKIIKKEYYYNNVLSTQFDYFYDAEGNLTEFILMNLGYEAQYNSGQKFTFAYSNGELINANEYRYANSTYTLNTSTDYSYGTDGKISSITETKNGVSETFTTSYDTSKGIMAPSLEKILGISETDWESPIVKMLMPSGN